tara:strand:- start:1983 stop:2903 length:921 start_codon:yes stop_codon:yes gene_type:complete
MSFSTEPKGTTVALVEAKGIPPTPLYFDIADNTGEPMAFIDKKHGQLTPLPRSLVVDEADRKREVWFLSGKAGSGKSYMSAELISLYRQAGHRVYVFTPRPDPKFGKDAKYLDIEKLVGLSNAYEEQVAKFHEAKIRFKYKKKELVDNPELLCQLELRLNRMKPDPGARGRIEFKMGQDKLDAMFSNSVILMDDYAEGTTGGQIKYFEFFRDFFLTMGRHIACNLIIVHHLTNDREKTRMLMTESTNIVLFQKNTPKSRKYLLKEYLDFDAKQIEDVEARMKARDRWVMIDKDSGYMMTPQKAMAL